MKLLRDTHVRRKASSKSDYTWGKDAAAVEVFSRYKNGERKVTLSFPTTCSGGHTDFRVVIGPKDYARILEAMGDADRDVAMAEMSATLAEMLRVEELIAPNGLDSTARGA